jgi:hypothetical protein
LLDILETDGPYCVILPGAKIEDLYGDQLQYSQRKYQVHCVIWIGLPKETDDDFVRLEAFVDGLASTLKAGAGVITTAVTWPEPTINVTASGSTIVIYDLLVSVVGC